MILALNSNQSITWGDLLILLAIAALILFILAFLPWRRR